MQPAAENLELHLCTVVWLITGF